MCGIVGIVGNSRCLVDQVLSLIKTRGPDHQGQVSIAGGRGVFGHSRLSILDLNPRSNQPFRSDCGRYFLVYNGEIYNYIELRKKLENEGDIFFTDSDTEVLLKWIIAKGEAGLCDLDGMFAFALYDEQENSIWFARDPVGEKPLYYTISRDIGEFAFCSEIKGLNILPHVDNSIDVDGLSDYLRFLYTAPPHTMYKGIKELSPGCSGRILLDTFQLEISRYFDIEQSLELDYSEDPYTRFRSLFMSSVAARLRSDVPVSVYLSAGLDSNAIFSAAQEISGSALDLKAFSVSYGGSREADAADESKIASEIATKSGVDIEIVPFSLDRPWEEAAERMLSLFSQPFGNSTALVADQLAGQVSRSCRVALVGDGGDELCVGYPRYKALPVQANLSGIPPFLASLVKNIGSRAARWAPSASMQRRLIKFCNSVGQSPAEAFLDWSTYIPNSNIDFVLGRKIHSEFYQELIATFERNQKDLFRAASLVDIKSFVPFNLMQCADRTSMAHSVELRSPFLSMDLVRFSVVQQPSVRVQRGENKPMLAKAMGALLPQEALAQPKRPFNPPLKEYIGKNFTGIKSLLGASGANINNFINPDWLHGQLTGFERGRLENSTLLWGLVLLELWMQRSDCRRI